MLAFLAFATGSIWAGVKEAPGRGKFIVLGLALAFDAVCLAIVIARYGQGVWFPSD